MLHIWLPTQQGQLYVWLDKQKQWQTHENWQSVGEHIAERKVCLYFPSRHVLQIDSDLSTAELKQLGETGRQYLFDDMALSNVEQLLIRQVSGAGRQYLYATAKTDIEQWKKSAALSGFDIQYLLPDFLLVEAPQETGNINLYHDQQTTLLRLSDANGMTVSYLPLMLEQLDLVDEVQVMECVQAVNENDSHIIDYREDVVAILNELNVLHSQISKSLKPVEQVSRHPLNFMVKEAKNKLSPYMQTALMVAAAALIMQLVADGLSIRQYTQATAATTQATNQQFKAWFPDTRLNSRTNLQAQLEPMLMTSSSRDSGSLSVLQQVSPLIKQSQVTAQGLLVEGETIKLQLVANNRGELDQLVQKLTQQGINAQLRAVNSIASPSSTDSAANANNTKKLMGELTIVTTSTTAKSDG